MDHEHVKCVIIKLLEKTKQEYFQDPGWRVIGQDTKSTIYKRKNW